MKVDIDDRPQRKTSHATWRPYAATMTVSALLSAGLIYVYSTGWGVTVDLQKLKEAFVENGKTEAKSWVDEPPREQSTATPASHPKVSQATNIQPKYGQALAYHVHPKSSPSYGWDVQMKKFNSIFIHHSACNPHDMKWTQMECSNFRARAMKRFGIEWNQGAYWDGIILIDNGEATERVNSALAW